MLTVAAIGMVTGREQTCGGGAVAGRVPASLSLQRGSRRIRKRRELQERLAFGDRAIADRIDDIGRPGASASSVDEKDAFARAGKRRSAARIIGFRRRR